MNSRNILYSKGNNDECMTPEYAVIPIIKYLNKSKIIWCPFDTSDSKFVKILLKNKFKIIYSHISEGKDFYIYEPKNWDIIVSNPPFTNKRIKYNNNNKITFSSSYFCYNLLPKQIIMEILKP